MTLVTRRTELLLCLSLILVSGVGGADAASVLYIHGDVAANGVVPSGEGVEPYDQMLLDDTGRTGLSDFRDLVRSQGHQITQVYDRDTTLTANLLNAHEVVIFGLHQKIWSGAEKSVLETWLQAGGGMLIYSDSASGGRFSLVGAQNPVGQSVTNNLIGAYGLQVTVDQADGVKAMTATSSNAIVSGPLTLEGEGVSTVAVSPSDSTTEILVPYTDPVNQTQNITIANAVWAALVLRPVGQGHISIMFDRQPMWNNGPGSDITKRNNEEILRRLINFLAEVPNQNDPEPPSQTPSARPVIGATMLLLDED
ncbi:MAG: hypothetical protein AAF197_00410 [Pseudomonadota bacterium]